MTLIKCKECGKEISDKANVCPNCDCPIEKQNIESTSNTSKQLVINQAEKKSVKKVIIIIAALAVIGIVIYNVKVVQPKRLEAQNKVIYEVAFYDGYKEGMDDELKEAFEPFLKMMGGKPVCIMKEGAQNGFGGNTTGYALFLYLEDEKAYKYVGNCDTLDIEEIDDDGKEEYVICGMINAYKDTLKQVSNVDLERIKNIIKNDAYTTIKIIE